LNEAGRRFSERRISEAQIKIARCGMHRSTANSACGTAIARSMIKQAVVVCGDIPVK
jgi:hypothetical protein